MRTRRFYFKWIGRLLLAAVLVFLLWNSSLVIYGLRQGWGQGKILWGARPVEDVLQDTSVSDTIKDGLRYLQEVRHFAMDSLGLATSDNYTAFYDHGKKSILWIVAACPPYSLEPYEWEYSFLGKMPYRGHFVYARAEKDYAELVEAGYDARIGRVRAWSTLGWFRDPILSGMLERSRGALAELIIHELTHATVFIPDDAERNENLASFIGEEGALRFLAWHFGPDSEELDSYRDDLADGKRYREHLMRGTEQLNELYTSWDASVPDSTKQRLKTESIRKIFRTADTLSLQRPERFYFMNHPDTLPNNTYFSGYLTYHARGAEFEQSLERDFAGDLPAFIAEQKERWE